MPHKTDGYHSERERESQSGRAWFLISYYLVIGLCQSHLLTQRSGE